MAYEAPGDDATSTPPAADGSRSSHDVLLLVVGIPLMIISAIFGFLMDLLGFYFTVGINLAIIVVAYMINPTLGSVVAVLLVIGWVLWGVLNLVAALGGDKLASKFMGKKAQ